MADRWPDLPDNLMDLVFELISVDLRDLARVTVVCKKWNRRIVTETEWMGYRRQIETLRQLLPCLNLPKLMLPEIIGAATPIRSFIEWKNHGRFNVDLGPAQEMRCIGSGHGWLINMTPDGEMNLFNPISHEMQPLPRYPVQFQQNQGDQFVCKAIVVMRPRTEAAEVVVWDDLWVAAILFGQLFWVRHGYDRRWTRVARALPSGYICDLAHSGGLLYVIKNDLSSVFVWRMASNRCEKVFFLTIPVTANLSFTYDHLKTYILEVNQEVIVVWRAMRPINDVRFRESFWNNHSLVVFRIDRNELRWQEVNDLGDCCLFLADYTSMALSPVPPNSQFEKNCVYFTPSCCTQDIEAYPSYWTVYNLYNGRCTRFHFDTSAAFRQSSTHWVTFSPITRRLPLPAANLDH